MNLRERAIKAAEEYEERKEKEKRETAKKFAERAKKEFEEIFGEVPYDVKPISEGQARIVADGLSFIARKKRVEYAEYINFYPQIMCSHCGKLFTYPYPCNNLVDVGMALTKEVVCDACREDTPPPMKSSAERVLDLLAEILEIVEGERGE